MSTVKARKQGNSIMVTIPSALGIEAGEEFFVIKKDNGAVSLIPKVTNPFEKAKDGEFYTPEENIEYIPSGNEFDDL